MSRSKLRCLELEQPFRNPATQGVIKVLLLQQAGASAHPDVNKVARNGHDSRVSLHTTAYLRFRNKCPATSKVNLS